MEKMCQCLFYLIVVVAMLYWSSTLYIARCTEFGLWSSSWRCGSVTIMRCHALIIFFKSHETFTNTFVCYAFYKAAANGVCYVLCCDG